VTAAGRLTLHTSDRVRLAAEHLAPADDAEPGVAVVLGHGFTLNRNRPAVRRAALAFTSVGAVVILDFRGHGGSSGHSTLGDREALDVEAAVRWARRRGYERVVTVGFSMGGAAVIRQAGIFGDVDAVVSVSATSRWFIRESTRLKLVALAVRSRPTRLVTRLAYGTRVTGDFTDVGPEPKAVVGSIAPTPLLVIHGERDPWFGPEHARTLAQSAGPSAEVWVLPEFGHAEEALDEELTARIVEWVRRQVRAAPRSEAERAGAQDRSPVLEDAPEVAPDPGGAPGYGTMPQ